MKSGRRAFVVGFLAPAVTLYGLLFLWPVLQALVMSFYSWSGFSDQRTFVGLKNFGDLAKDPIFRGALTHNLLILLVGGGLLLGIAITAAQLVQARDGLGRALRATYLLPHMVSVLIVGLMWKFVLNPSIGPVTMLARRLGWENPPTWLGEKSTALWCVIAAFVWYLFSFYTLLFAAGLKTIPEEVNEAAEIDGATGWQRFKMVTWPLLWSIKRMTMIHVSIASLNTFALVYVMTSGGPYRSTEVMLTYLYETAFSNTDFGYASALAVVNLVVVLIVAAVLRLVFRRNPTEARR